MCMICVEEATGVAAFIVWAAPFTRNWFYQRANRRRALTAFRPRNPWRGPGNIALLLGVFAVAYFLLETFSN